MKKYTWLVIIFSICFLFVSHLQAQSIEKKPLKRKQLTVKHGHVKGIVRKFKTPDPSSLNRPANNKESNFDAEMEKFNKDEYDADPQQLDAAMQRVDDNGYPMMENAYHRMAEEAEAKTTAQPATNFITQPDLNQEGTK